MMRVLHVHGRSRFQGGVEQIMFDLARGLAARGWPQALWSPEPAPDPLFASAFERLLQDPDEVPQFRPDVLVLHKWSDAAAVASLLRRYPSVQVVHDHDFYCPRKHKYYPGSLRICTERAGVACVRHLCLLERRSGRWPIGVTSLAEFRTRMAIARSATAHVAGSRYSANELVRNGYAPARIEVIPPVPASLGTAAICGPGDAGRMLYVGQIIRGKGLDLLLRAASTLVAPWQLDVVGDGRQREEYQRLAEQLGIADRVHFAGWVAHDALDGWYRRASFTVVPSRWPEPFGMIGLESMSRGRPVVAFDSGGIRDWLTDGVGGLLVREIAAAPLAAALRRLIDAPALVEELGAAAAPSCRARFTHSAYLDSMQIAIRRAAGATG
jgi:glycosyltransferase involved in cell wall biosynthesis